MAVKTFFCSACFRPSYALKESIGRESFNCHWCKATSRERAIFLQIHKHYILKKLENPFRDLKILGVSDGYLTSSILSKVYGKKYTNFHYHLEPRLDITDVSSDLYGTADIVTCSEVLEHVEPPIEKAFEGLNQLLKLDGVLVLSVPHTDNLGEHIEHFPVMKKSEVTIQAGVPVLKGEGADGQSLEFVDLVFHGGIGATLEYRIFSQASLLKYLKLSGFESFKIIRNHKFLGILWEPWSRVWVCKKTKQDQN